VILVVISAMVFTDKQLIYQETGLVDRINDIMYAMGNHCRIMMLPCKLWYKLLHLGFIPLLHVLNYHRRVA